MSNVLGECLAVLHRIIAIIMAFILVTPLGFSADLECICVSQKPCPPVQRTVLWPYSKELAKQRQTTEDISF
jgi:hypothetical protein